KKFEFYVIELNARLSRSSALASKATGYPLAYVAAKLALGKNLMEVKNQVTQVTQSFFEPALDYLVVKIPRWDMEKFNAIEEKIGSSMKSVGEVMAIGRSFEEAIQKAVRMLDIGVQGITDSLPLNGKNYRKYIDIPTPKRIFAITKGLKKGLSVKMICKKTGIDPWYLYRIKEIVKAETAVEKRKTLSKEVLLNLKQFGFSDKKIGGLTGKTELEIRSLRKRNNIVPSIFQIDTLAGEVPAKTNYLYTTYHGNHHDIKPLGKSSVLVLGSGSYRIGSSVEFDWSCVNAALALRKHKRKSIVVNCNPETVSTDYDISDRLYFEELSFERVSDIAEFEDPEGVIISVGGQTPNNLVKELHQNNIPILGTKAHDIDRGENRSKFSKLLDILNIPQPWWDTFTNKHELLRFVHRIGFPVLIRPSYVLSGQAMSVCYNKEELLRYIKKAVLVNRKYPITVSKFFTEAKEIELDAVAQNGNIKVYAISEHLEHAGVHSGDATIMYPPQRIYLLTEKKIITIAKKLAKSLHITGPFNIQYLAKENNVYVIEINLRASRTLPFISKATKVNFIKLFIKALYQPVREQLLEYPDYVLVKAPQFSFARLEGADPILRVEMSSTGEVACLGDTFEEAFLKAMYSTGIELRKKSALLSIGGIVNKKKFLDSVFTLRDMGFSLFATRKTYEFLRENNLQVDLVYKEHEGKNPSVTQLINDKLISLVINLSEKEEGEGRSFTKQLTDGYLIRRATIDNNIALFTDINKAMFFIGALKKYKADDLQIKSWKEYTSA
ncbi:carbamoyl-phosphate synthase large subunit, partial [Candidatus Roizmanbacteria bacterium]|nr:carbamoyl-phosphate synthase large subunit [Candidatus Roizmanbacteria bacterium]